jgi:hypothetical protein
MWKNTSGLSESELADLGFCKIAGSQLIFRHSTLLTTFGDEHPTGQDADVEAQPEYEESERTVPSTGKGALPVYPGTR